MALFNATELKREAAGRLARTPVNTKMLVLIHTGVLALLSLGSSGLNLFLDSQIGSTGGLGGMGLRSVLQTIQQVLDYVNVLFGPFWTAGFLYAMIGVVRGRQTGPGDLMAGFRRFPRVLAYVATDMVIAILVILAATNAATVIFSLSPWGIAFSNAVEPLLSDPSLFTAEGLLNLELIPTDVLIDATIPMLVIFALIFLPLYAFLCYCFRMSLYLVMDTDMGAVRAHAVSMQLLRGHKRKLLKLDLSFWWYYGLSALIGIVGYLDMILLLLGMELPLDPTVIFFVTLVLYCGLLLALHLWKKPQVDAAYILAYDAIAHPEEAVQ